MIDWVFDEKQRQHTYAQRFTFAPEWALNADFEGGLTATHPSLHGEVIRIVSLNNRTRSMPVVRGQTKPELNGWVSNSFRSMVPASTVGFSQEAVVGAFFATLFTYSLHLGVIPEAQRLGSSRMSVTLRWVKDGHRKMLSYRHRGSLAPVVRLIEA